MLRWGWLRAGSRVRVFKLNLLLGCGEGGVGLRRVSVAAPSRVRLFNSVLHLKVAWELDVGYMRVARVLHGDFMGLDGR